MASQGREKIQLIYTFTKMGFDILVADVDTVWYALCIVAVAHTPSVSNASSSLNISIMQVEEPAGVHG